MICPLLLAMTGSQAVLATIPLTVSVGMTSTVDDRIVVSAAGFGGGLIADTAITATQFVLGTAATKLICI